MHVALFLIPVLVTGIRQRRVCGAAESFQPKDLVWLDSCDEHRNEGSGMHGRCRNLVWGLRAISFRTA
ncbi:hypothetical protein SM0020_27516, partial [Sinorhizobium meliloti CCNWSX0020]